jgi:drug/metabolite transporter (DMT)-like permease
VLIGPGDIGANGISLAGAIVLILASLSWAIGSFWSRDADMPESGLLMTGMEMLGGGALLFLAGVIVGELRDFDVSAVSTASWVGWVYLIVFGSLIGFTSYIWLLDKVSPARIGTYAYVNPVVAVILGWAIAGETLSVRTGVAAVIVICAVALITTARSATTARSG